MATFTLSLSVGKLQPGTVLEEPEENHESMRLLCMA